ncbi:MAG: hypothetical protein PHO79_06865 [Desulfoplanes sp.]|nr:hypothetical protein [Desulfoplanes sp.]MDD4649718.1 hypothetical protein [Desulfoplanes sp.]
MLEESDRSVLKSLCGGWKQPGSDVELPVVDAVLREKVKQIPAPEIYAFIGFHITELIT